MWHEAGSLTHQRFPASDIICFANRSNLEERDKSSLLKVVVGAQGVRQITHRAAMQCAKVAGIYE